jgi:hypothetical protein
MFNSVYKYNCTIEGTSDHSIWSIALYAAEACTLRKVVLKYLKVFKCGAGEG